jgi:hypothetical protein
MNRSAPPTGATPPRAFQLADGTTIDLGPLARQLCTSYYEAYPDDRERYGEAGLAWCEHDGRYLLAWALEDARSGDVDCVAQVAWLGRVLNARSFPIDRLVHHVELTATLLGTVALGPTTDRAAERLAEAANQLRLQYGDQAGEPHPGIDIVPHPRSAVRS